MSANIKASTDGTQAIIGVGGVDQMTVSNAGVVTANSFVGLNGSSVTATGSTTARTLANRFGDVVNVKDFGADPTGTLDSTSAIIAAELQAYNSGNNLFFPAGTYLQNGSVRFRCSIIGYGATIKNTIGSEQTNNFGSAVIRIDGTSGIFIHGITVDANNWSTGFGAQSSNRVIYQDCIAKNCLNAGFNAYYCNEISYTNCQSIGVKYNATGLIAADGFYIGACKDISYINCIAENFERIGFVSEGESANDSYRSRYVSCLAKNGNNCDRSPTEFNAGFWMENTNGAVIDDCTVVDMAGNSGQTSGRVRGIVLAAIGDSEDHLTVLSNTTIGDSTGTLPVGISIAGISNKATVIVNNVRITNYNRGISILSGIDNVIIENLTLVDGKYLSSSHGGIVPDLSGGLINKISCSDVKELNPTYSNIDAATFHLFSTASSGSMEVYLNKFVGSVAMRQAAQSLIVSDSTITCRSTTYNILFGITLILSNTNFINSGSSGKVFTSSQTSTQQQITNCKFSGFTGGLQTLSVAEMIVNNCLFYDSQFQWTISNNNPTLKMSNCLFKMSGATECIRTNFYNVTKDTVIIQNCTFYTTATNAIELWNFTPDYLILQGNTFSSTNLTNMTPTSNVNNVSTP